MLAYAQSSETDTCQSDSKGRQEGRQEGQQEGQQDLNSNNSNSNSNNNNNTEMVMEIDRLPEEILAKIFCAVVLDEGFQKYGRMRLVSKKWDALLTSRFFRCIHQKEWVTGKYLNHM